MPKCSGVIGYALAGETQPGVWSESITEKKYYGDIIRDNRKIIDQGQINSGINVNNNISVVSNLFMINNIGFMKYVTLSNSEDSSKWKIESVELKSPRLILTIGGLYNG